MRLKCEPTSLYRRPLFCDLLRGMITSGTIRLLSLLILLLIPGIYASAASETGAIDSVATMKNTPEAADTGSVQPVPASPQPVSPATVPSPAVKPPRSAPDNELDSLEKLQIRDSLLGVEQSRRRLYAPDSATATDSIATGEMFRSDATSWIDVPFLRKEHTTPRIGIAGQGNRLLFMGNTAPLNRIYAGTRLLYETAESPLFGDDGWSSTEFSKITVGADGTRTMIPRTSTISTPESEFFWENGVFQENILLLRFTRPLSRQLQVNVFSNYRHFTGTLFSHEGNDVYSTFSYFTADTSLLSKKGYSPEVNEYSCGADLRWKGTAAELYGRVKYGDLTSELPINRIPVNEYPDHRRVVQFPLAFTGGIASRPAGHLFVDAECRWLTNPQRSIQSIQNASTYKTEIIKLVESDLSGAIRTGFDVTADDTVSLLGTIQRTQVTISDSLEPSALRYRPEVQWYHRFSSAAPIDGILLLHAGADFYSTDSAGVYSPIWNATLQSSVFDYRTVVYIEQDLRHYAPPVDSLIGTETLHDAYLRAGLRIERSWKKFNLLAGYQWCYGIDTLAVARSWASHAQPYRQPQSVFVIAPEFGRWKGIGLSSRLFLSDTRPFVKVQGALSFLVFPKLTNEAFDIRVEGNYWSERDLIVFAGKEKWNRPIVDVNFKATAHIKSFRLIYKIDNLLNRNFSYIPGYYAPGITFRWGFSWFIQR
jgi:hypothetical protein